MLPRSVARNPIRVKRLQAGFTQRELADLVGNHPSRISYIERGIHPNSREIRAIAVALGCDPADLQPEGQVERRDG